jgi:hypothetical protein
MVQSFSTSGTRLLDFTSSKKSLKIPKGNQKPISEEGQTITMVKRKETNNHIMMYNTLHRKRGSNTNPMTSQG